MKKDFLYPLRCLHGMMFEWNQCQKRKIHFFREYILPIVQYKRHNPKGCFLVMTPEHGNLGDHAIASAAIQMLNESGVKYYEITSWILSCMRRYEFLGILNGRTIFLNGGGNMGTLWPDVESLQRDLMIQNPKAKILILPNTVFYENTERGKQSLRDSIRVYSGQKRLTIYAREKTSFEYMKDIYRNVRLAPDMVLSLKKDMHRYDRSGCILCLRSDCEKTRTEDQERIIREQAKALFGDDVYDSDMVVGNRISIDQRESALEKKYAEFASAKLVITDRLHAMIFCAITATPCIVVDSRSPKVRGCYEWIKNLEYIHFAEDVSKITEIYTRIPQEEYVYDNSHLQKYYIELAEVVKEYAFG